MSGEERAEPEKCKKKKKNHHTDASVKLYLKLYLALVCTISRSPLNGIFFFFVIHDRLRGLFLT